MQTYSWENKVMERTSEPYSFEESAGRLKITIPVKVQWLLLVIYTFTLIAWVAMIGVILTYLFQGRSSGAVLTILLIGWLLTWLFLGRFLWNRWQFHAATRELLFIEGDRLIHRRPVSVFGITRTYDWAYVSPFYYSEKHKCPAFDYAYMHVYFGRSLKRGEAELLVNQINQRYFPDQGSDEASS
jgi:hypothetical protein